jgi:hypothetical protein
VSSSISGNTEITSHPLTSIRKRTHWSETVLNYEVETMLELLKVLGPFLGVLAAFGLQRAYDRYRDRQNRRKIKKNLQNELNSCIAQLTGKGMPLPLTMWNATVTSGEARLLSFDERTRLSSVYFEISNHNDEAKRVNDTAVVAQTGSHDSLRDGMPAPEAYWRRRRGSLLKDEENVKRRITELLKEPWWRE